MERGSIGETMLKKCYQPYTTLVWVETAAERQLWVDSACHIRQVESKTAVQPGEIKLGSSKPNDGQYKTYRQSTIGRGREKTFLSTGSILNRGKNRTPA